MAFDNNDFKGHLASILDHLYPWEKEARYDFGFYALQQWDKPDETRLDEEGRPHLTFDRTRPIIDAIAGTQVTSRYEAKFMPRDPGPEEPDVGSSQAPSKMYKWAWQRADMEHHVSSGFHSSLVCGVGCVETVMNYELDPDGMILSRRVPVFQMGWDPDSVEPNFEDGKKVLRDRWVDEDELKSLFDDSDIKAILARAQSSIDEGVRGGLLGQLVTREVDDGFKAYVNKRGQSYYQKRIKKVRLWELQRFERQYLSRIFVPPELVQMAGVPAEEFVEKREVATRVEELTAAVGAYNEQMQVVGGPSIEGGIRVIDDFPVRQYFRSYHVGDEMVREEPLPHNSFTYKFMTCFEDWHEEDSRYYFGFMRSMRDPQKYANKFLSHAVHMWSSNPKGALLYEEDFFEDDEEAKTEWAQATGMIKVNSGALSNSPKPKYEVVKNPITFRGVETLLQHSISSIPQAAGINESYFGGQVGDLRRTAAEAVSSVQEANLKSISGPFDSLRLFKKCHAKLMLSFVRHFVQDSVISKVLNQDEQMMAEILRSDDLENQYDVSVEEVPTSPNQEMEVFSKLMEVNFIGQLIDANMGVPTGLAKFFPVPPEVKLEMEQMFESANKAMQAKLQLETLMTQLQIMQIEMQMQGGASPPGVPEPGMGDQGGGEAVPPPAGEGNIVQ